MPVESERRRGSGHPHPGSASTTDRFQDVWSAPHPPPSIAVAVPRVDTGSRAWDRRRAPRLDGLVYSDRLRHPSTGKSAGHHVVQPERSYDGACGREEERNGRPRAHIAAQRPTPRVSQIVIRDGDSFEIALKRFSRRVQEAGILREVKRRRHYEPPSVKRKRKAQARVRKERKAAAKAAARGY